jgi:hypothetical protein
MTANRNAGYLRARRTAEAGVSVTQARRAGPIGDRLLQEHPEDGGRSATVVTVRDQFFGPVERPLFILAES